MKRLFLVVLIFPIFHVTSLLQAVNAARSNDVEFSAAYQAKKAGNEAFDQGVAGLLPTVSLDASYTKSLSSLRTDPKRFAVLTG